MKHPLHSVLPLAAVAVSLLLPLPAAALTFSGSFSGVASAQSMLGDDWGKAALYDGAPITGTFSVNISDAHLSTVDPDFYVDYGEGGHSLITFSIKGDSYAYLGVPGDCCNQGYLLAWPGTVDDPGQAVTFHDSFNLKFAGSSFGFSSPTASLFTVGDLGTMHIGPDTVSSFSAGFRNYEANALVSVDVRSFRFDTLAAPVPEPASALMLSLGLLGVLGTTAHPRRKLRSASRSVLS